MCRPSFVFFVTSLCASAIATASDFSADQLIDLPLEQLMQMDAVVTTASKRNEVMKDTASAIYVLTREDIRRSGVASIPDALRMVPGIQVARLSANEWAVSSRGLGGRFSRYLLVLVDGRSHYTALFSGVNWDELNIALESIERIEVVRGPGGTAWGANAVNGVVNIITRKPAATADLQLRTQVGQGDERGSLYVGGDLPINRSWALSIHSQLQGYEALETVDAIVPDRGWQSARIDAGLSNTGETHNTTVRAGYFASGNNQPWAALSVNPVGYEGLYSNEDKHAYYLDASGQWQTEGGTLNWRVSRDDTHRRSDLYRWDTLNHDLEARWHFNAWRGHRLTVGGQIRETRSLFEVYPNGLDITLDPELQTASTHSALVQDAWTLNDAWSVTMGVRYDANTLTDSALQPSLRGLWKYNESHRIWAGVSRAMSTPNRIFNSDSVLEVASFETDVPPFLPGIAALVSDGKTEDVILLAWELGYRWTASDAFNLDINVFTHDYENLFSVDAELTPELILRDGVPVVYLPFDTQADASQRSDGIEWALNYRFNDRLMLQWTGAFNEVQVSNENPFFGDSLNRSLNVPRWQSNARLMANLSERWQLDLWLRYLSSHSDVNEYTVLDARLAYRIASQASLSLALRNLGQPVTYEGSRELFNVGAYGVTPAVMLKLEWDLL